MDADINTGELENAALGRNRKKEDLPHGTADERRYTPREYRNRPTVALGPTEFKNE
jgi:hypothetical protein